MPGPGIAAMISAASRNSEKFAPLISMRPRQTKRHHLLECGLHRGSGKQRQRIDRHRAVVLGAVEGILERAVLGHQADGVVEIAVGDLAPLQRVDPEGALAVVAAAERRMPSARSDPTSTIMRNAWPSRKSPTRTLASLPHSMRADSLPRRNSLSSTTSSCSNVAVCMNSTEAASLIWPSPE